MDFPTDHFLKQSRMPALYLSKIHIQDFGVIVDESYDFHQGTNLIVDLNDERETAKGMLIMRAIEALLWPALGKVKTQAGPLDCSFPLDPPAGRHSLITGYFHERDKSGYQECAQLTLSVAVSEEISGRANYTWNGTTKLPSEVRTSLAKFGFHGASVMSVTQHMAFRESRLPIDFFSSELDEAKHIKGIKGNIAFLRSQTHVLTETMELGKYTKLRCEEIKSKAEKLLDPLYRGSAILEQRAQLSPLVSYTKMKKLRDRAGKLEQRIREQEARTQLEENMERQELIRREALMAKLVTHCDSSCESGPSEMGKMTLQRTLEKLKQELEGKRDVLHSIGAVTESFEALNERERALKDETEQKKSKLLSLRNTLTNLEADRCLLAARLKTVRDRNMSERSAEHTSGSLTLRVSLLEERYVNANVFRTSLEEELEKKLERLKNVSLEKSVIEKKLETREGKLIELLQDEIIEKRANEEATDPLFRHSGSEYERLEAVISNTMNPNHLQVMEAMTSILSKLNIGAKGEEWSSYGCFGAIIDHIDVDPQHRGLLHPIRNLLSTFLVRNLKAAWGLREELQRWEFEGCVNFFCFEDYERTPQQLQTPANTKPLSAYLKIKETHRFPLSMEYSKKLDHIISCELENYFVIEGQHAVASKVARELLKSLEWESYTFVIQDGTCYSRSMKRLPASRGDALGAYQLLSDYWDSKETEIRFRFEKIQRAERDRSRVQEETLAFLEAIRENLHEIDTLQTEIQWFNSAKNRLDRETEVISAEIDSLTAQGIAIQVAGGTPDALERELEAMLYQLDDHIIQFKDEIQSLNDSSSKSILEMADTLILRVAREEKNEKINRLQQEVSSLEMLVKDAEHFLGKYDDLGADSDGSGDAVRTVPRSGSKPALNRSRLFLLKQKLASIRRKIQEREEQAARADWKTDVDYERQLRCTEMEMRTRIIPPVKESLLRKLRSLLERASKLNLNLTVSMEASKQILDTAQETEFIPTLERDTLNAVLRQFQRIISSFMPPGRVRISEVPIPSEDKRTPVKKRGLSAELVVETPEFVGVTLDRSATEPGESQTPSKDEKLVLLISALIARAFLYPPRLLLANDGDVPFHSLPASLRKNFFDEFEHECQMFILTHDEFSKPYAVRHRIEIGPADKFHMSPHFVDTTEIDASTEAAEQAPLRAAFPPPSWHSTFLPGSSGAALLPRFLDPATELDVSELAPRPDGADFSVSSR